MNGLPFLPGNNFRDPTKQNFHITQTLGYKNGHRIPKHPEFGPGGDRLNFNQLSETELALLENYKPSLIYGRAKPEAPDNFVPATVAYDKKVLRFFGYFKQTVHESPSEFFRVRPVTILYYLEDDSMQVFEDPVENSGIPQGKLIRRHKFPKNDQGQTFSWKDLNLGQNLSIYGHTFRICDCDEFTTKWLESEGLIVNPPESIPKDPYIESRRKASELKTYKTKTDYDKLRQFIEMDRKVLRFYAVWDDRANAFGELRPFIIHYYLVDDTLEVREVHKANDGRDPFPVLIKRQKVPKNRYNVKSTFSSIYLELSNEEIKDYFRPHDFGMGQVANIYGRNFTIYDMDNFTKAFYYQNMGVSDFAPLRDENVLGTKNQPYAKMEIPPYNGYGSLEDSLQNCLHLVPEPPKKDYIKLLENQHKVLRYEALMETTRLEDQGRKFIISYRLSDDSVGIYEPPMRNSGVIGGKFLEFSRVARPGSTPDSPKFYGPQDFYIGAVINIFKHKFRIVGADLFVLKFAEEHADQFPREAIESLRAHLGNITGRVDAKERNTINIKRRPGDFDKIYNEIKNKLKASRITNAEELRQMFLKYDTDRTGYISKENIKDLFRKVTLPLDDDIIDTMMMEAGSNENGKINLYNFVKFFE
ncbi:unnamed protein product [Brachionus calyciflorus]|uniref:Uncharacterized protein n=1 Tax=Brachionus calyciflorus TaxID=104777 RepID=A0A813M6J2_9BILA|nr:unnamed protein product [Brachionus calyciflorus]